jgi:inosine-uridine nucleoside N-ribohydrolase
MKKLILLTVLSVICISCKPSAKDNKSSDNAVIETLSQTPVNLILDTDLGPDFDDVGAMALMHALADSGQVNILATLASNKDELVVPCIEALNIYFNRPDVPLGAPKSDGASLGDWHKVKWTEHLPATYKHTVQKTSDAPDALAVYRKILSSQPDQSVVICTIGFFTNLQNLLLSKPDQYSPLTGKELIAKKVKHLVSMAGAFPEGREFNVYCDPPASALIATEWPTDIIFSGFEIGEKILTGKRLIASSITNSPVKDTYALSLAETDFNGRMSWDQTAVLVAIKGTASYFLTERGTMVVDSDGNNTWTPDSDGRHIRLIPNMPLLEVGYLIESYMMHQPIK